jgi:hypothetical protein
MSWSTRFDHPIPLPDGGKLVTFQDASDYIIGLSPTIGLRPEWLTAAKILFAAAAEGTDFNRQAGIAIMTAIYGDQPTPQNPKHD